MVVYKNGQTIIRRVTASNFRGHNDSNYMEKKKGKLFLYPPIDPVSCRFKGTHATAKPSWACWTGRKGT